MIINSPDGSDRIDIVYTWVNGTDAAYAAIRNFWAEKYGVTVSPERDRDDLELLRYSLRSLEKYLPWAGNIYIVTARPQAPSWLNLAGNKTKLKLVHHDEIFTNQDALPTFNSFAIEHNLHRISGLSRYFIYMNDDYFLGRKMKKSDFITAAGKIRLYLEKDITPAAQEKENIRDPYGRIVANTNSYLDRYCGKGRRRHFRHGPLLIDKELLEEDDPEVLQSTANRFRSDTDIAFDYAYCHRTLSRPDGKAVAVPLWQVYLHTVFHMINNDFVSQQKKLRWIRRLRPKFYCLNDDMGTKPNGRVVGMISEFLESCYPQKSHFEK
jgi:hypothetical protein